MNAFTKRLLALFGGIAGCIVSATALTAVVEYKPWGVPDSQLETYDRKVSEIDQRNSLQDFYANKPRPIAIAASPFHHAGFVEPGATGSHSFTIRNSGDQPLDLDVLPNPSCDISLEVSTLATGESTKLAVTWTNPNEANDFDHRIKVRTNDPLKSTLHFAIRGRTSSRIVVPSATSFAVADPAIQTDGSFVVYSQMWPSFEVTDAESDLDLFEWHAEPITDADPELAGLNATSAWRVKVWTTRMEFGRYSGYLDLTIESPDGVELVHRVELNGRVRPPIIFHSPEIHMVDGLDMGTVFSGKEHQFHLLVRVRGDLDRKIEVLNVKPDELRATIEPQSINGNYRLTVTIPADCPMVVFNLPQKHGFVEVGDPNSPQFKNWFPVHGAVVPPER